MAKYNLFLFDLDDTLLDFQESERLSFVSTLKGLGIQMPAGEMYEFYQQENRALWKRFEEGQTSKEHLKVERFRRLFEKFQFDISSQKASDLYLETLPETVVLIDHAVETCQWLSERGEIGIVTNGIQSVQSKRIGKSALAPYISFVSVSEEAGFAKPDTRFFEYSVKMAKSFSKNSSIVIGDRIETDILGAKNFGLDSVWFNPNKQASSPEVKPHFEINHLSEIRNIMESV